MQRWKYTETGHYTEQDALTHTPCIQWWWSDRQKYLCTHSPCAIDSGLSVKSKKASVLIHTRPCIYTSNKKTKRQVRINSTVNVIRACIFIMLSVLEVTQRVPPTCTIKTFHGPFPHRLQCSPSRKWSVVEGGGFLLDTGFLLAGFLLCARFLDTGFLESDGFLETGFLETGFLETGFLETGFLDSGFLDSGGFLESGGFCRGWLVAGPATKEAGRERCRFERSRFTWSSSSCSSDDEEDGEDVRIRILILPLLCLLCLLHVHVCLLFVFFVLEECQGFSELSNDHQSMVRNVTSNVNVECLCNM